jgi:hypothetical protein
LSTLAAEGTLPPGHLLVGINRSMSTRVFAASAADLRVQLIDLIAKLVPRQAS